ncbi:MAG: class III extradiol ring-cleavage dioxygenase [Rhizomicrobium sp.]|nr:class III extradiol ring-cleavage dioxygenase [Rhizomicrobium sp.]
MLPALFVSHGSPTLPLDDVPARDFLRGLAAQIPRPKAILAVSAHWETAAPTLNAVAQNSTIHDFHGFPPALYKLAYNAPGAPEIASELAGLLERAGLPARLDTSRGLDHGAWVPLMLMYPQADIPVLQLSVQPRLSPAHHVALGKALQPFRESGLILASGGFVHNLRALDWNSGPEPEWSQRYAAWMDSAILERRTDDLAAYRRQAPEAVRAHPSEDHILPLFVAYGAGEKATRLHHSATFGSLRMDAYRFD